MNSPRTVPSLSHLLTLQMPRYLESLDCGNCLKPGALKLFGTYPSLDVANCELYICSECSALYNTSSEILDIDNDVSQTDWLGTENFYIVPPEKDLFASKVEEANNIFLFFRNNVAWNKRWKHYFEIGAGSGITAVAALRHFDQVDVADLTDERLLQAQKMSRSHRYTIVELAKLDEVEFDFFLAWHVFEHLVRPGQVLLNVIDRLAPGGALCIQVPLLTERHIYPGHIYMHNQNSFETILRGTALTKRQYFYDTNLCAMTLFGIKQ